MSSLYFLILLFIPYYHGGLCYDINFNKKSQKFIVSNNVLYHAIIGNWLISQNKQSFDNLEDAQTFVKIHCPEGLVNKGK